MSKTVQERLGMSSAMITEAVDQYGIRATSMALGVSEKTLLRIYREQYARVVKAGYVREAA